MFDSLSTEGRFGLFDLLRHFFFDHGRDLAMAASLLGGAAAERRVASCADRLKAASHIDQRLTRDLHALHRLLSLDDVGDPDLLETALFADIDPASAEVETVCRLTDLLGDLLRDIDAAASLRTRCSEGSNLVAA